MSPYIVTVTKWVPPGPTTGKPETLILARRAVATLDEAREHTHSIVIDAPGATAARDELACTRMLESGGSVGPLPDGTVIEVERVEWEDLAESLTTQAGMTEPEIIAAYNEAQS